MAKRGYKNYTVKEDYFEHWSSDMAYILGFIVADGCLRDDGYYVKIDICPKDISVLQFMCEKITPDYELKFSKRGTEVRWYPSSKFMKESLIKHGVLPNKTGKEQVPSALPDEYFWDFVRGYFDGDGNVDTEVQITCNSEEFLQNLKDVACVGRVHRDRMNARWSIGSKKDVAKMFYCMYDNKKFCLLRKKERMKYLVNGHTVSGRFSPEEDAFLTEEYFSKTRFDLAFKLGRTPTSVKNRARKLGLRKEGALSVELQAT